MPKNCNRCGAVMDDEVQGCPSCGMQVRPTYSCRSCGSHVRKDDGYCWNCGALLEHELHCWHCGSAVSTRFTYCPVCGAPQPDMVQLLRRTAEGERGRIAVPERRVFDQQSREVAGREVRVALPAPRPVEVSPVTPEADRLKIVTVLFADVSGFTKMSENLDPEEVKDIMSECFVGLTEEITCRGGTIDKYIGDCVMALFGAQVAQADDPERALDAALAMQVFLCRFSKDLHHRSGIALSMRIGINTGKVLAGYLGQGDNQDFTVMGDAVNLASRLEHACPVGSILASYDTYRMARGLFRGKKLEPIRVKGKSEPIRVVEVLGRQPGGINLMEHTFRGVRTQMIGRERELNQLRSAYARMRDRRQPILVTIRSQIGMGKSRLVSEFASWLLSEAGCELDFVRCRDYRTESTYAPVLELMHRLVGAQTGEELEGLSKKIRVYLEGLSMAGEDLERVEAAMNHLLGVPAAQLPLLSVLADDPEQLGAAVRDGILTLFRARAEGGTVVLAVEDIHAASSSVLDLLATLASLEDLPMLLVLSYRPDADAMVEQRFGLHDNRIHVSLEALTDMDANDMIHDLLQKVEALPTDLIQKVEQVCQGRPLFIEEVLADMVERGVIRCGEDRWDLDLSRVQEIALPQSIEAAILSRVDALPQASREALQIASVVGDVCWENLIAGLAVSEARSVLGDLHERQFIRFRSRSQIVGEREFCFLLPAVRETVENHVLKKVKVRLHAAIAEWIEARVNREHELFNRLLGHHHYEAGDATRALPYRMRAGHKAEERGDAGRALEDLQWVWKQVRDDGGKLLLEPLALVETRVSVARLLRLTGSPEEAMAAYKETLEVFSEIANEQPAIDIGLRRAGLHTARSMIQAGSHSRAAELLDQVLQGLDKERPEARRLSAAVLKRQGWIEYLEHRYDKALELYNRGISLVEVDGPSHELASLLDGIGVCLSRIERFDGAEKSLKRALQVSIASSYRDGQAGTQGNLGVLRYRQRRFDEALEHFQQARRLNEALGSLVDAAICRSNIGDVLLEQGRATAARAELEGALAVFARTRSLEHRAAALQSLLKCLRKQGDRQSERRRAAELLTIARELGQPELEKSALALTEQLDAQDGNVNA